MNDSVRVEMEKWGDGGNCSNCSDPCYFYPTHFLDEEFWLVGVVGLGVSLFAIAENGVIFWLFLTREYFRRGNFFYLTILAALDLCHCVLYILVFSGSLWYQRWEWVEGNHVWHFVVIPFTTIDYILLCISGYLIVAASFERTLRKTKAMHSLPRRVIRIFCLLGALLISLGTDMPIYWEMEVKERRECPPWTRFILDETPLKKNRDYAVMVSFWLRNVTNLFLPFSFLLLLNIPWAYLKSLITKLKIKRTTSSAGDIRRRSRAMSRQEEALRNTLVWIGAIKGLELPEMEEEPMMQGGTIQATKASAKALLYIIIEYLVCNGLSIFLTTWETLDAKSLAAWGDGRFYTLAGDVVSLLTVAGPSLRLPIYCLCDAMLWRELKAFLLRQKPVVGRGRRSPAHRYASNNIEPWDNSTLV